MLSWKLWHSLFDIPLRWRLRKVLVPESLFEHFGIVESANIGTIIWMGLCGILPFIIIPATVTSLAMRLAWTTASVLARQYEFGRFDTLAATSLGGLEMMLEVGRICCKPVCQSALTFFIFAVSTISGIIILLSLMSKSLNLLLTGGVVILVVSLIVYIDYRQTFIASFLMGILAGTTRERTIARLGVVVGCGVMQLAIYSTGFIIFFAALTYLPVNRSSDTQALWLFIMVIITAVVPYLLREAIIFILWRTIKIRLNDDMPTLKPI
jgi:hypothetical protein